MRRAQVVAAVGRRAPVELLVLPLVLLLHAEALAVPRQVGDARVRPEGHAGDRVAHDVHHDDRALGRKGKRTRTVWPFTVSPAGVPF